MRESSKAKQPKFYGNWEDLEQFLRLATSPIRSEERESALHEWEAYKLGKQVQYVRSELLGERSKRGLWKKGHYQRALVAPAIDLRGGVFKDVCLGYADLRGVRLDDASFTVENIPWFAMKGAKLERASLRKAQLPGARLMGADLRHADITGANLEGADLLGADIEGADLTGANLRGADLSGANITHADLCRADLCGSRVYGVAAWDVKLDEETLQRDLIVTPQGEPEITSDNIEVAQFLYLLLSNEKIRGVIDTVCKKGVLILGRFIAERKVVLDALRDELRRRGYVPMVFDFQKPTERDFTETVKTLAGLCRFIIADITNPKSSPLELQATIPDYQVPFVPIVAEGEQPFSMFADLRRKYHWVLDPYAYHSAEQLIEMIEPAVIGPALNKHAELLAAKAETIRIRHAADYAGE
jgi:hypothetical protein